MSVMVATGRAAQAGVLFRDAEAIENLRRIDTLVVDKTGTLTEGRPAFGKAIGVGGFDETEVLRLAASLDQVSEHPLAEAIVAEARRRGLGLVTPEGFERSEEHTSELQSLMRISYAVFCLTKKNTTTDT